MKILFLGLNYLPESTSIGPYTADLAEYMLRRGHDVRVVTGFPTAPQWKIWKGYEGKWFMREVLNGVPILRTYIHLPQNPRKTSSRILFDSSFAISALVAVFTGKRPDLVMAISPPLQLGLTALMIGAFCRSRVFLHIQDIVPDAAVAVGALRPGSIGTRIAHALERFVYRKSSGIGVICEGMQKNLLAKGVPTEKLAVLPNYIDSEFVRPLAKNNDFRSKFGIGSRHFLVMYSGSIAGKQGLNTFVQAGAAFEQQAEVTCCIIGEGPHLPKLQETAKQLSMQRFRFLPLQPRESLPAQLSAADVLVITQLGTVKDVVFPGKLLYYMAAGRAILGAVNEESETGRFIREKGVGVVVPPEDPARLVQAICWMQAHPQEMLEFGRNGRRVVETQFDRSIVLEHFARHLEGH